MLFEDVRKGGNSSAMSQEIDWQERFTPKEGLVER